jgi:hypothetical protein
MYSDNPPPFSRTDLLWLAAFYFAGMYFGITVLHVSWTVSIVIGIMMMFAISFVIEGWPIFLGGFVMAVCYGMYLLAQSML